VSRTLKQALKAVLLFALAIGYLLFPACSVEETRTLFVLRATLAEYLDETDSDLQVRRSRFGYPVPLRYGGSHYFINSVRQPVPGTIEWPLDIPSGRSALEFTVGFLCAEETPLSCVCVRVTAEANGAEEMLYERDFLVRFPDRQFVFYSEEIPLERYAGRSVILTFQSSTEESDLGGVQIVWGNPSLFVEERTGLPNIVLICIDTLRRDRVECYNPDFPTPALQRLAEDGVVFEHAISQSPWTLPSVATVLTGLNPSLHRAGRRIFFETERSGEDLSEEERRQGMIIGRSRFMLARLDSSVRTLPELLGGRYITHMVNSNGILSPSTDVVNRFHSFVDGAPHGRMVTRRAADWAAANKDKLFFLYAHYLEPHEWGSYYSARYGRPEAFDRVAAREVYDDLVHMADVYVGRLLDRLVELGIYDSALIVLYSDHGEHLWEENWNLKGHGNSLSNILLEVPLIVKFPNSQYAGARVDQYVQLLDIFATILEEAGIPADDPRYAQGISLRRYAAGLPLPERRDFISEYMLHGRERIAVQQGEYRLIYNYSNERFRFFDAASDRQLSMGAGAGAGASDDLRRQAERLQEVLRSYLEMVAQLPDEFQRIEFTDEEARRLQEVGYLR